MHNRYKLSNKQYQKKCEEIDAIQDKVKQKYKRFYEDNKDYFERLTGKIIKNC